MNEIFNSEGVKSAMSELEGHFETFAGALKEINTTVNELVNNGENSAIFGEVGTVLLNTWNYNASTFGDFHNNFQNWTEVVSVIAENNKEFMVTAESIYRSNGANLDGVQDKKEAYAANPTASDYYKNAEERSAEYEKEAADFIAVYGAISNGTNAWLNNYGNLSTEARMIVDAEKLRQEENSQEVTVNSSTLKVGDVVSAGVLGEFIYQGFVQRGDMTQEQIFSKDGKVYYFDNGEMKPVTTESVDVSQSMYSDGAVAYDYSTQATLADLGVKTLYFQNASGKYDGADANKTYTTSVDTDGSTSSSSGYSVVTTDFNNWDKDNYEGKGTTILIPDESYDGTESIQEAKDMIITSIIAVRNNIAQEATEMQTYLDMNRTSLSPTEIENLTAQISDRNTLATQMGKDVTFGWTVSDGVIGDMGTPLWYTANDKQAYKKVLETINGYQSTLSTFKSLDDIVS